MNFTISISRITDNIYATSALHSLLHARKERPEVLTRDHRPALENAIRNTFAHVCFRLLRFTNDCNIPTDDEILFIDLNLPQSFPSAGIKPLQTLLESAITDDTLAVAYENFDTTLATTHRTAAADAIKRISTALVGPDNAALTPHW